MKLSSHVLDTTTGTPANPIVLALYAIEKPKREVDAETRTRLSQGVTDTFDVARYFRDRNVSTFYDVIAVRFVIDDAERNYHIPLLLSPYAYTTYRGS
jgi:5-hydroxyisourate hydrolase